MLAHSLAEWAQNHSKKFKDRRDRALSEETALVVSHVSPDGDASILGRLGDLGLSQGEKIYFFGTAPLGEPIYISVRETVIALRLAEASLILVSEPGSTL